MQNAHPARLFSWLEMRQGMFAIAVIVMLFSLVFVGNTPAQAASPNYSCGNLSVNHCYGKLEWFGPTNGANTDISVVKLNCPPLYCYNQQFIDDEMWLVDHNRDNNHNDNCNIYRGSINSCWVEAGYGTTSTSYVTTGEYYFWADERYCCGFASHLVSVVPSADYGHYTAFTILQMSSSSFRVNINTPTKALGPYYSTSNFMYADTIQIGQELAGTSNCSASFCQVSAPTAYFENNEFHEPSSGWNYQNSTGVPDTSDPPYLVINDGARGAANRGGIYSTHCC